MKTASKRQVAVEALRRKFSQKQLALLRTPSADLNIIWGTTGSGKTYSTNILILYRLMRLIKPGSLYLFSGYTIEALYDNVIREMLKFDRGIGDLEYVGTKGGQRLVIRRRNIEVACVGASTEAAKDRVQGKNVAGWYADEVPKHPKSFVEMALSRCRDVDERGNLVVTPAHWTGNADHPEHFIKTDYIDKADNKSIREWTFTFADNPTATKEYIAKQMTRYSGVFRKRMIDNIWARNEGVVYDRFDPTEHVFDVGSETEKRLRARIKRWFLSIDWGYEHPMCICLVGEMGDGQYVVWDEIYDRKLLVDEKLRDKIVDRKWPLKEIDSALCDPARPDYIYAFESHTGIPSRAARNEVTEGIQAVQKKLEPRDDGEYGLYFRKAAQNVIREFGIYAWNTNRRDEPIKEDDHGPDSVRYAIYTSEKSGQYDRMMANMANEKIKIVS